MIHIPAQGESATWSERGPDPEDVRAWISSALPGQPEIVGPIVVHRAHAWGLTARYRITYPDPHDLVFKASFLPPEFSVAAPYRLLRRSGATGIPKLLAWTDAPDRRWLLFRAFQGTPAGDLPGIDPLIAVATAMARIQRRIAALPTATARRFLGPATPITEIPALLDRLIAVVRREGPLDTAERLDAARGDVLACVRELEDGGWPMSIHHVDLHPHNAVIPADGAALIFDWEEAALGFPFFALDKLLLAAADRSPDGPSTVRAAYLNAIPWHPPTERERAFNLALRLSPIRFADADARFARALGWSETDAVVQWIPLALERWERAESTP